MSGWIKLHRSLLDWEWWNDAESVKLLIYILLKVNHEDKKWCGITVKRGQLVTSIENLAIANSMSIKQIRLRLDKLEKTGEISRKKTNKYTVITVCKYDTYQCIDESKGQTKGKQKANEGQTEGKQRATTKEYKNDKNVKNERINNNDKSLYVEFVNSFNQIKGSKYKPTKKIETQFNARIRESFTIEQMLAALKCAMKSKYHIDTGYKYLTPEFFTRSDKIEMYLNESIDNQEPVQKILELLN